MGILIACSWPLQSAAIFLMHIAGLNSRGYSDSLQWSVAILSINNINISVYIEEIQPGRREAREKAMDREAWRGVVRQ